MCSSDLRVQSIFLHPGWRIGSSRNRVRKKYKGERRGPTEHRLSRSFLETMLEGQPAEREGWRCKKPLARSIRQTLRLRKAASLNSRIRIVENFYGLQVSRLIHQIGRSNILDQIFCRFFKFEMKRRGENS